MSIENIPNIWGDDSIRNIIYGPSHCQRCHINPAIREINGTWLCDDCNKEINHCSSKCFIHNEYCKRPKKHIGLHNYVCDCVGSYDYVIDKDGKEHYKNKR